MNGPNSARNGITLAAAAEKRCRVGIRADVVRDGGGGGGGGGW